MLGATAPTDRQFTLAQTVWIFGCGRSGSTWLSEMLASFDGWSSWPEPGFGHIFKRPEKVEAFHESPMYVLGGEPVLRQHAIRGFVAAAVQARYPNLGSDDVLVLKDQNASAGASEISTALPESRFIALLRDPRDVFASVVAATRPGSWAAEVIGTDERLRLDDQGQAQKIYSALTSQLEATIAAYEAHRGPKSLITYEDLRFNTAATLQRLFVELGLQPLDPSIPHVVLKHDFDRIPATERGETKFRRSASPGAWRQTLSADHLRIVEAPLPPLLAQHYSETDQPATTKRGAMASRYRAYTVDVNLPNNAHSFQLQMIGEGKRVLELGAAGGDVTRALRDRGCKVTVVEYDAANREELEEVAEKTIIGDLNDPATLEQIEGPFDVVLAGDVLEHLLEPDRVLRQVSALLAPGGRVVVSLPNVAHVDVRLALLEGRWDYAPLGLLDNTHIRFFTRKTVRELVESAGLGIVEMRTVRVPAFGSEIGAKRGLVPDTVLAQILADPDAETYQFVFTAVRISDDDNTSQLAVTYGELRERFDRLQRDFDATKLELELLKASKTLIYTAKPRAVLHKIRAALRQR